MTTKWQPRPIRIPDVGPTINTTPLIDLLLVLLVMLILSVPIATHKVPLDLPSVDPPPGAPPPPVHRLAIAADGGLSWDGSAIADVALAPRLAAMARDPANPELHLAADGEARYERVDETLAAVLRAGITRVGFVDNGRFLRTLDGRARP